MSFPRDAIYIQDWSPASGLPYHTYLQSKRYERSLLYAIPESLFELITTEDQLHSLGYTVAPQQNVPNYRILMRDISGLEQSIMLGASEITSTLRWNMTLLAIGMPRVNDAPEKLDASQDIATMLQASGLVSLPKDLIEAPKPKASPWAYEQFVMARSEYVQGHYRAALEHITQAISGDEMHLGHASDFRLPFLLGRLRIGSWCGTYKNAIPNVIDPQKAETAFLDASRLLRHTPGHPHNETDSVHCTLWAARAAYYHGDLTRAIGNSAQAAKTLTPANGSLYTIAQHQYAKYLCTRGAGNDLSLCADILRQIVVNDSQLLLETVSDPQFIAHSDMLENVIKTTKQDAQTTYKKDRGELAELLRVLATYSYADNSASTLLHDEIREMTEVRDQATKAAEQGGLINLISASKKLTDILPKQGFLFSLFRTRFSDACTREWESMPVTQGAKSAKEHYQACKEAYAAAEAYYREHGGFNRNGGQEKLGYAIIFSLLTLYMVAAQSHWGNHAIILALIFMIAACWLYWSYMRIRLGLVEGYDAWRKAKSALDNAQTAQDRRNSAASKAWNVFQRNIDTLGSLKAPF